MGTLPAGYKRLQYIQSSGTQYIDTGFVPNQDSKVVILAETLDGVADAGAGKAFVAFGAATTYNANAFECYSGFNGYMFTYDGQYNSIGKIEKNQKVLITLDKNISSVKIGDNEEVSHVFQKNPFTSPDTLTLFASHRAEMFFGENRIYSCSVYDNDTLVRDFIPCETADGNVGLYDVVNGVYYANAGTGAFAGGPEVSNTSVQQQNLQAIADAIRAKEGSTASIPAQEFADRIRAISTAPSGLHTVTVQPNDPAWGSVSGGGLASEGMTVLVKAEPALKYSFQHWLEQGEIVSSDKAYAFPVYGDRALTAAFRKEVDLAFQTAALPASMRWASLAYGLGKFIAIAQYTGSASQTTTAYSTDGKTWTAGEKLPYYTGNTSLGISWFDIIFDDVNNRFVAVSRDSTKGALSTNGTSWTSTTCPALYPSGSSSNGFIANFLAQGDYNGVRRYVTVNNNSKVSSESAYINAAALTSGSYWQYTDIPLTGGWGPIAYGNGRFVALRSGYDDFAYSDDGGATWTTGKTAVAWTWGKMVYGGGRFVVLTGSSGSYLSDKGMWSDDGLTWHEIKLPVTGNFWALAYGGGVFVALANASDDFVYSEDGKTWKSGKMPVAGNWQAITYGNGRFVAITYNSNVVAYCDVA